MADTVATHSASSYEGGAPVAANGFHDSKSHVDPLHNGSPNGISNGTQNGTQNGEPDVVVTAQGVGQGPDVAINGGQAQGEVICGPLLNYKRMEGLSSASPTWHGSVLLVLKPENEVPVLHLDFGTEIRSSSVPVDDAGFDGPTPSSKQSRETLSAIKLYSDPRKTFWRFDLAVPLRSTGARWDYTIPDIRFSGGEGRAGCTRSFFVPSSSESMRIMFHSCNGFSVGTDEEFWSGPALWNDVMRVHEKKPFHVMIGGGDQIYNDSVRVSGPLREWTDIGNPRRRREYPFGEDMRTRCDEFYFQNYATWYSTGAFATANAQIPQINIWDDHDIIDGFGSYTDHFMNSHVFRGIGGVAHKYYMLFQHHFPPPVSTYTSDAPQTAQNPGPGSTAADPQQLGDTFVRKEPHEDPCWIIGPKPGPYVQEHSRSLYMRLGRRIAFVGLDARTERTRHQVNYPETYDLIFSRLNRELSEAQGEIKHLIVLLGVPIAYPRLIWLENVLTSPIIGPIRFLNKRFGIAGDFFNHFDGQVDLLDDLDDHYTARQHKKERKVLMHQLQQLARHHNARITILGGDVHLGALGRFYSNPKLGIATPNDHRYMANVISSAITNKPPPKAVANMLASRNKIHHLDHDTDETLLNLFDKQPGGVAKASAKNHCTMPSRNYAILSETVPVDAEHQPGLNAGHTATGLDGHKPLHRGEEGCGVSHPAAAGIDTRAVAGEEPYGLDVSLRVEIDNSDRSGKTEGYGFHIPALHVLQT
ncbi:MAG: hypothetical protein M1825_003041 [Sarcosagium campestre]|nr:MAG: hypothetical protein M1825_003041 [Sarcosagium campestre]